jgi:hypothetical protein
MRTNITQDDEYKLFLVTSDDWTSSYSLALDIVDAARGFTINEITTIEYIDIGYVSPEIFNLLSKI